MRNRHIVILAAIAIWTCGILAGCGRAGNGQVSDNKLETERKVHGALLEKTSPDAAPQAVREAVLAEEPAGEYEDLLENEGVRAAALMLCPDSVSAEGYGILVCKGEVTSRFPDIRHGRMPRARYLETENCLWLVGADMEGTGTQVERLYRLSLDRDGQAGIAASVDPFDVQTVLQQHLAYDVDGSTVTLYADGRQIFTMVSSVENMGELDRDAVWIGEQLTYDISGPTPKVCVVPGLRFTAGPVLVYDEMPAITASIHFGENGLTVDGFKIEEQ
ncbi:MAG: hypothetical protein IJL64_00750 [Bacteroidales bacterium]|nr:hypothetical protein [Bacteroidales bacterium]